MNLRKWLVYSFTPILAASMMSGVAMASKHKKKKKADTATSETTQTGSSSSHKHKKKSEKSNTAETTKTASTSTHKAKREHTKSNAAETTKAAPATAPAQPSSMAASHTSSSKASRSHEATPTQSSAEINQAKARGMVWVNSETKVYHTGGRYYGNTKHGQFMTLQQAKQAGYRAAKR